MNKIAYFHLPGLFEFYPFYEKFLPLFRMHREYFYAWCEIGSIYGVPGDCLWAGGRVEYGDISQKQVLELVQNYGISARLTFSNSLLEEIHLKDQRCNDLCTLFAKKNRVENGVIVHSDLLLSYLQKQYPNLYLVSSTTKVLTDFSAFLQEVKREEFRYVVPDFRLNKRLKDLQKMTQPKKDKLEFLCNECCDFGCKDRKQCYEEVSRIHLGENKVEHQCKSQHAKEGYRFSKAMENPGFISREDIENWYLPNGFSQFKIEGRGLGSALVLEFLLYYMTKPEYHIHVREALYLDNMLDLF